MSVAQRKQGKKKHILRTVLIIVLCVVILIITGWTILIKKLNTSYPALPKSPEAGQWYSVSPEGTKSSDGSGWHGLIRLGTENKVLVFFYGGGVSLNDETSESEEWFFIPTVAAQDLFVSNGIFAQTEDNPFKDWTFLAIEYSTGDFHCGQGEHRFTDKNGKEKIVYHNGYNNYAAYMDAVTPYIGQPDTLVVTGSSAGGFATALLTDDVMARIPSATNVTACVDSALLYYDGWQETAAHIWEAPQFIRDKLKGDNIVLDCLEDLHTKHPNTKILFTCSVRDKDLQRYQAYINYGKLEETKENGEQMARDLTRFYGELGENLPEAGVYIWEYGVNPETGSTQHMIMPSNIFDQLSGEASVAQWLYDAVNGIVKSYGTDLLDVGEV